jgi:hypothetical protein
MMRRRLLTVSLLFAICISAFPPAAPAAEPPESELATAAADWHFLIAPYLWLPEVHGSIAARGASASFEIDFDELFDALGNGDLFGLMGHFEVRHRRFSFFVDSIHSWAQAEVSGNPVADLRVTSKTEMRVTMVQFGPTYRVLEHPTPVGDPLWVEILVGGRVWYADTDVATTTTTRLETQSASGSVNGGWAEPLVGLRWSIPLGLEGLNLNAWGDIGGFGAGSEFTWNVQGLVDYRLPWKLGHADVILAAGYRAIDFDRDTGAGGGKKELELNLRGPILGAAFAF